MAPKAEESTTTMEEVATPEMETVPLKDEAVEAPAADGKSDATADGTETSDAEKETSAETVEDATETELQEAAKGMDFSKQLACFDLSTLACCGFGSPIMYTEDGLESEKTDKFLSQSSQEKAQQEKLENEKATQIQKFVRAKIARNAAAKINNESTTEEASSAESSSQPITATKSESAPEAAPSKSSGKSGQKSFFQKLANIFSGCKKSDKQVVA